MKHLISSDHCWYKKSEHVFFFFKFLKTCSRKKNKIKCNIYFNLSNLLFYKNVYISRNLVDFKITRYLWFINPWKLQHSSFYPQNVKCQINLSVAFERRRTKLLTVLVVKLKILNGNEFVKFSILFRVKKSCFSVKKYTSDRVL